MVQRMKTTRIETDDDIRDLVHWYVGDLSFVRVANIGIFDEWSMVNSSGEFEKVVLVVVMISGPRSWFLWSRRSIQRGLDYAFGAASRRFGYRYCVMVARDAHRR